MKTYITDFQGNRSVVEIPMPKIKETQALVQTLACGICGTDTKVIQGTFKNVDESQYPLMLGHEGVGRVVEIGEKVTSFAVGDRVVLPFLDPDPLFGDLGSAWGAFSEYAIIHDAAAFDDPAEVPEAALAQRVLPPTIDSVDAVMIVTFREVLSSIRYFGIQPEDTVVVYGSGPVATTFVKMMSLLGVKELTTVVRNQAKEVLMRESGATFVVNTSKVEAVKAIREKYPEGVAYVLDAVGSPDVINEAMKLLKDRGEILCYGVPGTNEMTLDWSAADYNWKMNFQQMPYKKEEGQCHDQVIQWIEEGKLVPSEFISDVYPFEKIDEAFDRFLVHGIQKKCVISYE